MSKSTTTPRQSTRRGGGTATVDYLLHQGFPIHITATDDSHDIPRDAFGGWVMVAARDLTSDAILAALKAGDFYASTGPDILSITRDGTVIEIETSPVQRIILPLTSTMPNQSPATASRGHAST